MMKDIPLGKHTEYISQYDKSLIFPIPRTDNRARLGIQAGDQLPFTGLDIWTGYELSWLNAKGKPEVAIVEFVIPAEAPNIVESKSFKLYLNSFNQTKVESREKLKETLEKDLSEGFGVPIQASLFAVDAYPLQAQPKAQLIDDLDVECTEYEPNGDLLVVDQSESHSTTLCSNLLKSNCPVTGQPDWATVWVEYSGSKIDPESLLKYIVSFRDHSDFHEHCVERIYCDLMSKGQFDTLVVTARYTRRGGLDINPIRSLKPVSIRDAIGRTARQ